MDWSGMRVLMVGRGDAPSVGSAQSFLSARCARLDLCGDPSEALALLTVEGYEALLVCVDDIGEEALGPIRAIRRLHPEAAIIVSASPEGRRRALVALKLGADVVLPEPFYRDELITLVERVRGRIEGLAAPGAAPFAPDLVTVAEPPELAGAPDILTVDTGMVLGDVQVTAAEPSAPGLQPPAPSPEPATPAPEPPVSAGVSADEQAALMDWPDEPDARFEPAPEDLEEAPPEVVAEPEGPAEYAARADEAEEPSVGVAAALAEGPAGPSAVDSAAAAATERALKRQGVRGRILLVDRERLFRELVADVLRQDGYYVADAADEKQALWCLAEDDYDAIVMDARVSGHNGQTVNAFRDASPETPVVVVTSLASREQESALLEAGAAACLGKPFDMDQLTQVLARVMGPRRPSHPILTPEELDALLAPDAGPALTADLDPGRDEPDMGF